MRWAERFIPKVINNDSLVFRPEFIKPLTAFDKFRVFKGPMRQHPGPLVLEHVAQKREPVSRPELRKNKELERFR